MVAKIKRTEQQWVRILSKNELPAITSVATMLDKFSDNDTASIPYLSKAILHDQGLSSCLLKVVNNTPRIAVSRVNTVSRAAIVLGIRAVKNICLTSKVLGGLLASQNLSPEIHHRLTMLMANAFYAGLLAKMMVPNHSEDTQEQVYLAAMMYNIGETSFWSTPNECANILIKEAGLPSEKFQQRCEQLLSFDFNALSIGLAKTWNLGELLIKSLDSPESRTVEMQTISLANQLSEAISQPPENKLIFDNILKRICVNMKIEVKFLKQRIEQTRELAIQLLSAYGASILEHHIKPLPVASDFINPVSSTFLLEISKERALLTTVKSLTQLCKQSHNINDYLTLTLQQSAITLGFDRCVFWMLSADRKKIEARSCYDKAGNLQTLHRCLHISNNVNLISHVLEMDKAIIVESPRDPKWSTYITIELTKLVAGGTICLAPVKLDNKIIGIVSGQHLSECEKISADDFSQFCFLIEHLNICLSFIAPR
ncbi:hypothetical protein CW745_02200 [Psychromonas sp. psych-6C06]|uniref:HDOD domain-containing protein n=1 Tax=Psychromonas sp. psych-6C06 TaxID=2058089 RepID=UPI000C328D10|nr:HDOD domain-containing protein [Psychromonas sp. psych-6C06]PKF63679.1 hypothetical protein CW745_02200 [Psychromonas sp. psych-6C06]